MAERTAAAAGHFGAGRRRSALGRGLGRVLHHSAYRLRLGEYAWELVERELSSRVVVPPRAKLAMWRRGFLSESWVLYDLARNDPDLYLNDYDRYVRSRLINGRYATVLDDKLVFDRFFRGFAHRLPHIHGMVHRGRARETTGEIERPADWLLDLLKRHGKLVLKPVKGGSSVGVSVLRLDGAGVRHGDATLGEADLPGLLAGLEHSLVSEHVDQHPALARIYPRTVNTIRILTMQDDDTAPFVAAAALRVGTELSASDSWRQGGLSADVDLVSGELGAGAGYPDERARPTWATQYPEPAGPIPGWSQAGLSIAVDPQSGACGQGAAYPAGRDRLVWHVRHPDTDAPIEGERIPHWGDVVAWILAMCRAWPPLRYVGWDVVVTEDGFRVLEGNSYSGVTVMQLHRPLLADPRVAAFYRRHGVVRR